MFNKEENKNLIIAFLLFILVSIGADYFFNRSHQSTETEQNNITVQETSHKEEHASNVTTTKNCQHIVTENDNLIGSISLVGGILDQVKLKKYKETINQNSDNVILFTPDKYFFSINYLTDTDAINNDTKWEVISDQPAIRAITKSGIEIIRKFTLDDNYLITVQDIITNNGQRNLTLNGKAQIVMQTPDLHNYSVVHEGVILNQDGKVREIKYNKIKNKNFDSCHWAGFTDLYWLCSIVHPEGIVDCLTQSKDTYNITVSKSTQLNIGQKIELKYELFTGPKDINLLNNYTKKIDKFNMAIDFGWFFIITKPLSQLIGMMANWFNSMGLVILLLTIMFRIITYPLMKKSFISIAKMKKLQPKISQMQKIYANDKLKLNQQLVSIYKTEGVSPFSGFMPMILQAVIFFCLYKVFFISFHMRHAPLFGWIRDLSAPDTCYLFNLFGLINWLPPSFLQIGIWPIIMGLTMILQQKLSMVSTSIDTDNRPEQKMQRKMMYFMPVFFTFICASFPVSIVIYWTISNIIGLFQQRYVNKKILN